MKKVITYGTFDMLHYGHTRLLERAKALGDYLIVGVTDDSEVPLDDRKLVLSGIKYVDRVVTAEPDPTKAQEKFGFNRLFS